MSNKFLFQDVREGHTPNLEEILEDRENRVIFQKKLCNLFPNQTLIALKVNMPGPVKNNMFVENLLLKGKSQISKNLKDNEYIISYEKLVSTKCGISYFVVIDTENANRVKMELIQFEDNYSLGRLFDLDVFIDHKQISRSQLNVGARNCYLCTKQAKDCGRNRTHTVDELLKYMLEVVNESR